MQTNEIRVCRWLPNGVDRYKRDSMTPTESSPKIGRGGRVWTCIGWFADAPWQKCDVLAGSFCLKKYEGKLGPVRSLRYPTEAFLVSGNYRIRRKRIFVSYEWKRIFVSSQETSFCFQETKFRFLESRVVGEPIAESRVVGEPNGNKILFPLETRFRFWISFLM